MALAFETFSYGRKWPVSPTWSYYGWWCPGNTKAWGILPWSLQWRHNGRDGVSNLQPHDCLLNRLFRRRSKKIKAPRHWPLCGEFTVTGEFPAQMASNAENVSLWWRHHGADLVFPECFGLGTERVKLTSVFIAIPTSLQTAKGSYTLKLWVLWFNFMISNWHRVGLHSYSTYMI